jgi:hypothetical protein
MKKAGLMAEPKNVYDVRFQFEDVGTLDFPVIQGDNVTFGYEEVRSSETSRLSALPSSFLRLPFIPIFQRRPFGFFL